MGSYATIESMIETFGEEDLIEITDTEKPFKDQINVVKLQRAIDAANGEVDAHLSSKLSVPTVVNSPFVQTLAHDIARYRAVLGNARESKRDKERYDDAVKNLEKINEGKKGTGASTAETNAAPSINLSQMTSGRPSVFGNSQY